MILGTAAYMSERQGPPRRPPRNQPGLVPATFQARSAAVPTTGGRPSAQERRFFAVLSADLYPCVHETPRAHRRGGVFSGYERTRTEDADDQRYREVESHVGTRDFSVAAPRSSGIFRDLLGQAGTQGGAAWGRPHPLRQASLSHASPYRHTLCTCDSGPRLAHGKASPLEKGAGARPRRLRPPITTAPT